MAGDTPRAVVLHWAVAGGTGAHATATRHRQGIQNDDPVRRVGRENGTVWKALRAQ
jgi:hypothetical protein